MDGSMYSLSDIAALMGNRKGDGFLEGNGIIILILFFLLIGRNGSWGGNNSGSFTRAEMYEGFNNQEVNNKLDGITNGICNGFYTANTTMLNGFNGIGNQIADSRYAMQDCCCNVNRNIDALKYTSSQNACDIITAQNANTQRILDTLCQNKFEAMQSKLAEKDIALQTANFQLSQQAQNAYLINALQPTPRPAYLTCSPYQAQMSAWYNYGNSCGC